jgi:AcrR family transcriptional regulator
VVQTLELASARPDKFTERRLELAKAALKTLSELGYAKTSLREIAQNTEFSHGLLHYYFSDKLDLITCCVRYYKAECVTRYDQITVDARTREELLDGFIEKLTGTVREEAPLHRLWYDLRAQALFEPAFQGDVAAIDQSLEAMVWRVASRYAELGGTVPTLEPPILYALFDGLFQKALLRFLSKDERALPDLAEQVRALLPRLV